MLDKILNELNLNALIITDPYNMRHVSGFRGGEGALYISAAQKVLIIRLQIYRAGCKGKRFYCY